MKDNLCELFGTGFQPLECRFCHHSRTGLGPRCHRDLEKDWDSPKGRALVSRWNRLTGFWEKQDPHLKQMILQKPGALGGLAVENKAE